jgi:hypothetical protein
MPDFNASLASVLATPILQRAKVNALAGRLRVFEAVYVAPASGTAPAIADRIIWGKLPVRSRLMGHLAQLQWSAGTASCTLNLGDSLNAARHLAATAITTAGTAVPNAASFLKVAVGDITNGSNTILNCRPIGAFQVGDNITAGTGVVNTRITGVSGSSVTISAPATATTAALAITVAGGMFETSDDSGLVLPTGFAATTDDCTLFSTVAGAQIANNQVLRLTMPYVQD